MVSIDGAAHAGEGLLEAQHAGHVVALLLQALGRQHHGIDAEERQRGRTGLRRRATRQRSQDVTARLSLPVRVHDRNLAVTSNLEVPR